MKKVSISILPNPLFLDIDKALTYLKFESKWNLIISYNPKFVEKYYKAIYYIDKIKEAMVDDDIISIFTYSDNKLKRSVNRKKVQNIDLDENFDNFLNAKFDIAHTDSNNFFQRFKEFLKQNHEETRKQLMSDKYKNLVIAFTSATEWSQSKMDEETDRFILSMRNDNATDEEALNVCVIVIIFPDQALLEGKSTCTQYEYLCLV